MIRDNQKGIIDKAMRGGPFYLRFILLVSAWVIALAGYGFVLFVGNGVSSKVCGSDSNGGHVARACLAAFFLFAALVTFIVGSKAKNQDTAMIQLEKLPRTHDVKAYLEERVRQDTSKSRSIAAASAASAVGLVAMMLWPLMLHFAGVTESDSKLTFKIGEFVICCLAVFSLLCLAYMSLVETRAVTVYSAAGKVGLLDPEPSDQVGAAEVECVQRSRRHSAG
ncbi:hypothetical protein [Neorickettsia sp. 179522]|uniref:hypothetical protein n=1 Tax=Neorickettsia sp. 179522 TaxID=1714371 RepID=UPI000799CCD6|nr:hypothetical protein [Neorickettsia sp. 179522]KYH12267.1 hypothetical protein AS219_00325 [Neorickettsia sp. 179522]